MRDVLRRHSQRSRDAARSQNFHPNQANPDYGMATLHVNFLGAQVEAVEQYPHLPEVDEHAACDRTFDHGQRRRFLQIMEFPRYEIRRRGSTKLAKRKPGL